MANDGIKIAIVGGGLAGLAAAMRIAEAGHAVDQSAKFHGNSILRGGQQPASAKDSLVIQ